MDDVCYDFLKELKIEVANHVVDDFVIDHVVYVNDVEYNVTEHVDAKAKDEDAQKICMWAIC